MNMVCSFLWIACAIGSAISLILGDLTETERVMHIILLPCYVCASTAFRICDKLDV